MPNRTWIQDALARTFRRAPILQAFLLSVSDVWYQVALCPFRRSPNRGCTAEDNRLVSRTEEFNDAAERYFANHEDIDYLLNKPFSDAHNLARHLMNVGIIIEALRIVPGDVVVEVGAGSCWLSHMLNLYGCRTVSVDVSATALHIGRQVFERDPRTKWSLNPQFERYDGHRLPLATDACDRIVINDAFHHIPNQRELLSEMYRILKADGLVVMSEPGRGHGSSASSTEEVARSGVLENELVLEDLSVLAVSCGFATVNVCAAMPLARYEVDATDLGAFMGGKHFAAYWKSFCSALEQHHYIVLQKSSEYTTRHPSILRAHIDVEGDHTWTRVPISTSPRMTIRTSNVGDTTWLHGEGAGWTRLGVHLYVNDGQTLELVDYDWLRVGLPRDVRPGESIDLQVQVPPINDPGVYTVVVDLVVEGVAWFGERGSEPACAQINIVAA